MAQRIAQLFAEISGDSSKLQSSLTQAKSKLGDMKGSLNDTMKALTGFDLKTIGVGAAIGALVGGLKKAISETQQYNMDMAQFARVTGTGVEATSRMVQWTDDLGLELGSLEAAARGAAMKGIALNTEQLAKMSDEYIKLAPGAERNTYLLENFGKSGLEMARVLEVGSAKINDLSEGIADNMIVTEDAAQASKDYALAMDNLNDSITGVLRTIGNKLIPILDKEIDGLNNIVTLYGLEEIARKKKLYTGMELLGMEMMITRGIITQEDMIELLTKAIKANEDALNFRKRAVNDNLIADKDWSIATGVLNIKITDQVIATDDLTKKYGALASGVPWEQLIQNGKDYAKSLEEQAKAADTAALALGGLTNRYMFDTLVEMYGLTADNEQWWDLAESLGVIDKDTRENVTNWQNLIKVTKEQNLQLKDIEQNVYAVGGAVRGLPTEWPINVTLIDNFSQQLRNLGYNWGISTGNGGQSNTTVIPGISGGPGDLGNTGYTYPSLGLPPQGPGFQQGGSFIIPPGYRETWALGGGRFASSGETVTVTPKGKTATNVTININGYERDATELAHQISRVIQRAH